jgi:dTDP-glucose 4,6-dehydratase
MKLVVITGCLGFIGSYVTRSCLDKGWKVYGIDKCTYASKPELLTEFNKNENFSFLKEDIATLQSLPDCDYVINIAAETHVGNSILDSSDFIHTNVDGVKNLLDLIRHKPANICKKPIFFHFSTDEVYGDIKEGAHTESDLLNPSNPYSASKAASDMLIKAWARTYGLEYVILRPTNNYGIHQHHEKLVPLAIKLLQWGKKIRLHDAGDPIRNWLHASDTAAAVIKIIEQGSVNEIYNVAGGFEQKNKDTVKTIIKEYFGTDENWENYVDLGHTRPGQDVRYSLDDTKLQSLGWKPEKFFDLEIKKIVQFYKKRFYW